MKMPSRLVITIAMVAAFSVQAPQTAVAQDTEAAMPAPQATFPSFWPWNISGTWDAVSNNTEGTLTIKQEPSSSRCKRLTGVFSALDVTPIIGLYCPTSLRITFGRYFHGESGPGQIYEGYVSDRGTFMGGSFMYWGNEGPMLNPDAPFLARRRQ